MAHHDNGLSAWESNAEYWDNKMGNESNFFHRSLIRPTVDELLKVKPNDLVLDIACGNGNYSETMAKMGASVVAFDYSSKMIELAKKRRKEVLDQVQFFVCDATQYDDLIQLKQKRLFTKAISNMAIMDISEIGPLFQAVYEVLEQDGIFVISTHHPCFTYQNGNYLESYIHQGEAILGQPVLQNYYHRSISEILDVAFKVGFVLDRFCEIPEPNENIPIVMIIRLIKK